MNFKLKAILAKIVYVAPLLFILTMFMLYLILPDKTFSIEERRYLAQWPNVKIEEVLNGSYGSKIELYFSDQFPFRDFWLSVQAGTEHILGGLS